MLPTTTTTTTTLFLPDSRARMRDRVQENKEKEQNRRSEKQSILKTFKHDVAFSFFPPRCMTLMLCFCMVVRCLRRQGASGSRFFLFFCECVCAQPSQKANHAMSMS